MYVPDWLMHFFPPLIGRWQLRRAVIGPALRTGSVISSGSRGLSRLSSTWLSSVKGVRFSILSSRLDDSTNCEAAPNNRVRDRGVAIIKNTGLFDIFVAM